MKFQRNLLTAAALTLVVSSANAGTVLTYTSGFHNEGWLTAGSNGATVNIVYGDGAYSGISPGNKCIDNTVSAPFQTCASLSGLSGYPAVVINGDNGPYQTNVGGATPVAALRG